MNQLVFTFLTGVLAAGTHAVFAQTPEPGSVPEAQSPAPVGVTPHRPNGLVRVSVGVIAGLKVSGDAPLYPEDARAQGVSGSVVLHAILGEDGHVKSLTVVSGNSTLADAALDAVKTWVYTPYLLNGRPTAVDTTITVNFQRTDAASSAGTPIAHTTPTMPSPSLPPGRFRVSSGVMSGQRIFGGHPVVPYGVSTSGGVVLHAVIGKDGSVQSLSTLRGSPELAQAVIDAVKEWRYKPYLLNGEPVEVDTTIILNW